MYVDFINSYFLSTFYSAVDLLLLGLVTNSDCIFDSPMTMNATFEIRYDEVGHRTMGSPSPYIARVAPRKHCSC